MRGMSMTVTNLRAAAGDVEARLVRRDCNAEGLRGVALQLIERDFNWLADVGTEDGECVCKGATVFEVGEGNQVFGMVFRDRSQASVGGERDVKDAGNSVQGNAIDNDGAGSIDDSDFRLRRGVDGANGDSG